MHAAQDHFISTISLQTQRKAVSDARAGNPVHRRSGRDEHMPRQGFSSPARQNGKLMTAGLLTRHGMWARTRFGCLNYVSG